MVSLTVSEGGVVLAQAHPYRNLQDARLMGGGAAAVASRGPTWLLSTAPVRGEVRASFPAFIADDDLPW